MEPQQNDGDRGAGAGLTIVVPAYNEARRLPRTLPRVIEYAKSLGEPAEVIVVDDGSTDGTGDVAAAAVGPGDPLPRAADLIYVGGGQDREQALIADDLAAKGPELIEAVAGGAALLAVCGGYQLLGRSYLDRSGVELTGVGLFPHATVAGERRMIGDILLECELDRGERRTCRPKPISARRC